VNGKRSTVNGSCLAGLMLLLPLVGAQGGPARYTEARLACATFREAVDTEIRTSVGTSIREERAGRAGLLLLRASAGDSGLGVLAWFDSLTVWRQGPEGRSVPDTEGLLGGRWRGLMDSRGRYSGRVVPFIPGEVAEVAELRGILEDFFPLLPDTALGDGATWRWSTQTSGDSTTIVDDTLAVPVHRESTEAGSLVWSAEMGPIRWEREITVTAKIPPGRAFPRGVVSVVKQLIRVARTGSACSDR
jgi:hypothetical protein